MRSVAVAMAAGDPDTGEFLLEKRGCAGIFLLGEVGLTLHDFLRAAFARFGAFDVDLLRPFGSIGEEGQSIVMELREPARDGKELFLAFIIPHEDRPRMERPDDRDMIREHGHFPALDRQGRLHDLPLEHDFFLCDDFEGQCF